VRHNGLTVGSVGSHVDLTYDVEHLGEGADALSALLAGKGPKGFTAAMQVKSSSRLT
jgi:hypothetical protein